MIKTTFLFLVCLLVVACGQTPVKNDAQAIAKQKLIGKWLGDDDGEEAFLVFRKDGTADLVQGGKSFEQEATRRNGSVRYSLDASVTPMALDIKVYDALAQRRGTLKMIVEFTGDDQLRIAADTNFKERPKGFLTNSRDVDVLQLQRTNKKPARLAKSTEPQLSESEKFSLNKKACADSDAQACVRLADNYQFGDGVRKDRKKALETYKKACDLGEMRGCSKRNYRTTINNNNKPYKIPKSLEVNQDECRNNDMSACFRLARQYAKGLVTTKDYSKAYTFYKQACENDYMDACVELAKLYQRGRGVEKSPKTAVQYLKKACDNKNPMGCTSLGSKYESGSGVDKSLRKAKKLYEKSCKLGSSLGCTYYFSIKK